MYDDESARPENVRGEMTSAIFSFIMSAALFAGAVGFAIDGVRQYQSRKEWAVFQAEHPIGILEGKKGDVVMRAVPGRDVDLLHWQALQPHYEWSFRK